MRIGHGYDVHRLVEGRKLILGGVSIPWDKGLPKTQLAKTQLPRKAPTPPADMEQCRPVRLLPVFGGEGGLNFALYGIGKIIEKIVTGAGLYLIYRVGIVEHAAPALVICVWHNKSP